MRDLLVHRVFYSLGLAVVAVGLLAGISLWLFLVSEEVEEAGWVHAGHQEPGAQNPQLTLTQLVARQLSSATCVAEVRAATAQLLEDWQGFHVRQVEVSLSGAAGESAPGFLSGATGPVHFEADEGWIDSSEGNLLLTGDIHGRRASDGLELWARRLEYEPALDEVRLLAVRLRRPPDFEKQDPFLVTDTGLKRLRSGVAESGRSRHPFFQRYGGGGVDEG